MRETIPLAALTLRGSMAHFRKFYATTSALTYPFPPRTTLMGLVAGLLGRNRDTYYEAFRSENLWVSVRILVPVRIRAFTVNYLFTKGGALYSEGRGTQIPLHWVLPRPPHRTLAYRVYVSTPDSGLWEEMVRVFREGTFRWPAYLGITEAMAWISDIWIGETELFLPEEPVTLVTPFPHHPDLRLGLGGATGHRALLLDEFTEDFVSAEPGGWWKRVPRRTITLMFEEAGRPVQVYVPYPVFRIPEDEGVAGAFLHAFRVPSGHPA